MAGKKLAACVWVGGEFFPAGSTPAAEIADQIDNPKAWADVADADAADEKPKRAARSQKQK